MSRREPEPLRWIGVTGMMTRYRLLDKMQQLVQEKAIFAPIWQLGFLNGVGPRVGESGFDRIPGFAYTAPFEDLTIKGKA